VTPAAASVLQVPSGNGKNARAATAPWTHHATLDRQPCRVDAVDLPIPMPIVRTAAMTLAL